MKVRRSFFLAAPLVGLLLGSSSLAALFPSQALVDHLLCCGTAGRNAAKHVLAASDAIARSALAGGAVATSVATESGTTSTSAQSARTDKSDTTKPAKALEEEDGHVKLGFDRLASYVFKVPPFDPSANPNVTPPSGEEQIPDWLKKLSGKKAVVTGFMLPLKMKDNLVTEFLLLSDPMMCCYGAVPEMNQWIVVKMKNGGVRPIQDIPISFYGDIKIGAMFENGYMTGIYALDCDKMGEMKG